MKEEYLTIPSDELVSSLLTNEYIEKVGVGDRYNSDFSGLNNDYWKVDNTYNWEITDTDTDDTTNRYYSLSNNFEIRESDKFLVLSKHISGDVRANYENDIIYIKINEMSFFEMVLDHLELSKLDK